MTGDCCGDCCNVAADVSLAKDTCVFTIYRSGNCVPYARSLHGRLISAFSASRPGLFVCPKNTPS